MKAVREIVLLFCIGCISFSGGDVPIRYVERDRAK